MSTAAKTLPAQWASALRQALVHMVPERLQAMEVRELACIDSSNSELTRQAQAGHIHPQIIWAHTQTAGRGRLGREWHTGHSTPAADANPTWQSLSFSIGLAYAPQDWSGLSLAVGCAVAEALDESIALKWPNDICLPLDATKGTYAKLGGILLETTPLPAHTHLPQAATPSARWLIIGVGLNLQGSPQHPELRNPSTDLKHALGQRADSTLADVPALCHKLIVAITQAALQFEAQGFAPFAARFHARDILLGQPVLIHSTAHTTTPEAGIALGVGPDGSYQVRTADGQTQVLRSAEISLRPHHS